MLVATVAGEYRDFNPAYAATAADENLDEGRGNEHISVTNPEFQLLLSQGFHLEPSYLTPATSTAPSLHHQQQLHHQHHHHASPLLPSQVSTTESQYLEQALLASQLPPRMSVTTTSSYSSAFEEQQGSYVYHNHQLHSGRKRRQDEYFQDYQQDYQHGLPSQSYHEATPTHAPFASTPHSEHSHLDTNAYARVSQSQRQSPQSGHMVTQLQQPQPLPQQPQQQQQQQHHHHHHRLPSQPPAKILRGESGDSSVLESDIGPPTMVGQEGMPAPAPRPKGPKLKFTGEDDSLLVELKERKNLTWKQIADFFPGRSSGTLQVRYCTKLKAKTTVWTDDMVQKLRNAVSEYENDRWRIISSKVGSGFSAAACREKMEELDILLPAETLSPGAAEDDEDEGEAG